MRRKAQTEGCIAALRWRYPCKARQNPALCFVGDDLRAKSRHFVLCAPKHRPAGGQCPHRPGNPAMAQTPSGGRKRPPCKASGTGCGPASASPYTEAAAARRSRFYRPYALYCRAGVHARRKGLRQGKHCGSCKRRSAPPKAAAEPRGGRNLPPCKSFEDRQFHTNIGRPSYLPSPLTTPPCRATMPEKAALRDGKRKDAAPP